MTEQLREIDYVKKYRDMGLNLIPCHRKSKIPSIQWKQYNDIIYDGPIPDDANIAVVCGRTSNNLVDIDLDDDTLFEHFKEYKGKTLITKTGKKGYHLFFRTHENPRTIRLDNCKSHVDIQGHGTIAILPPSIHPDTGKRYEIISDAPILQLSNIEPILLKLKELGFKPSKSQRKASEIANSNIQPGERHNAAISYCNHLLFKVGLDEKTAIHEMTRWNEALSFPLPNDELNRITDDCIRYFERNQPEIIEIKPGTDVLSKITDIISRTVKDDLDLVHHILFNAFSAFTSKPFHLMINEKTSEGKTYPALEIAQYLPKNNVIILASATPQTFKYARGILVDEYYKPIQDELDELKGSIDLADDTKKKKLKKQLRNLVSKSKTLIDLRNTWIIFKEPPDRKLLEMLYSTLSSDEEFSEHKIVTKSDSGRNKLSTVVLRGTPAVLIATTNDETKSKRWMETFSRFTIVSPVSSSEKYRKGMELINQKMGLPKELYDEAVINESQKNECKQLINHVIQNIKKTNGECFNPFLEELSKQFPQESGYRWRQMQRFLNLINIHAFCEYEKRMQLVMYGKKIPTITKRDLHWANTLSKNGEIVPAYKMTWFREIFIPCWKKYGLEPESFDATDRPVIIVNEIKNYIEEIQKGKTSTKIIRETFLETLYDYGLIDKAQDPRNKTRYVYWPFGRITESKSSLIAESSFDELCVRACLDKYLKGRFHFELNGNKLNQEEFLKHVLELD